MSDAVTKGPLDVRAVMAALPHRYPMLLVDRVEEIILDRSIRAIKAVSMNEGFFQGHFPGRPIVPGVVVLDRVLAAIEAGHGGALGALQRLLEGN